MNLLNRAERFPKPFRIMLVCLICIFSVLIVIELFVWNEDNMRIPEAANGKAVFFYEELSHNAHIDDIDATEQYIFFLYSSHGVVAAYGWDGSYKYSVAFYRHTNGTLDMQVSDGLLFVNDHEQYTYIFDGKNLISTLNPSENPHGYLWYQSSSKLVYIEKDKVFDMDNTYIMNLPGYY